MLRAATVAARCVNGAASAVAGRARRRLTTAEQVALAETALRAVDDPLLAAPADIVTTGMASVAAADDTLTITLDVRTAAHPHAYDIAERARIALEGSGVASDCAIRLVASGFGHAVGPEDALAGVRSCVAVSSCKGGVGKSTVAAHLAHALAARGGRVGLVDADVMGPSAPTVLGLEDARVEASPAGGGLALPVESRGGVRVASLGFVNVAPSTKPGAALRGPLAGRVAAQLFRMTDWGELDYLVVDLPPGVGDVTLGVCAAVAVEAAVVVTTPSRLARVDVLKGLELQEGLGVPTAAVVENLAVAVCPGCGAENRPFGAGHAAELAAAAGVAPEGVFRVPISPAVAAANEAGAVGDAAPEPVFLSLADRVIREVYTSMHARRDAVLDVKYDGKLGRVVVRSFRDGEATEAFLEPNDVRAGRDFSEGLAPTAVRLVGNRSVVFDWSDGVKDDVYAVSALLDRARGGAG